MKLVFLMLFMTTGSDVLAAPPGDLTNYFQDQWERVNETTNSLEATGTRGDSWIMDKFFLNISPDVTLGVPGVANMTITPEIEFIWARESSSD